MERRNIKNLRIIRALLGKPDGTLTKYRTAKLAGCSLPWVLEFLKNLERKKLVKGTKIISTEKIIDAYIEIMPKIRHLEGFVKDPEGFFKRMKLPYVLTTYAAENYTSHHLFLTRFDAYIMEKDMEKWKSLILKHGLFGRGNIRLLAAYDESIFKEATKIKGMPLASFPQLLIDLKKEGGVAIEAYNLMVERNVQGY